MHYVTKCQNILTKTLIWIKSFDMIKT